MHSKISPVLLTLCTQLTRHFPSPQTHSRLTSLAEHRDIPCEHDAQDIIRAINMESPRGTTDDLPQTQLTKVSSPPHILSLTGLRAIAALIVTYSHFAGSGNTLGQFGVQLFFALSAFLMCLLYVETPRGKTIVGRWRFAVGFLQNRLARVVPLAAFVVLVSLLLKDIPGCERFNVYQINKPLWEYLTLRRASSIQWTIAVEVAFYIFFAVLLLLPYREMLTVLQFLTSLALISFVHPASSKFESMTNIRWGLVTKKAYVYKWFMLGVLAFDVHRFLSSRKSQGHASAYLRFFLHMLATSVLIGFTTLRLADWHLSEKAWNRWDNEIDAILIPVLILASLWVVPFRLLLESRVLQHIGKVSYSLYLTHMFVFFLFALHGWNRGNNPLLFVAFVSASTVLSTFTFKFVERPALRALRTSEARSSMPEWAKPVAGEDLLPLYYALVSTK